MSATTNQSTNPSGSSYVDRQLSFQIQLGKGTFGSSGFNTVTLPPLRAHCSIVRNGAPANSTAEMEIYGVSEDIMNQISTLGAPRPYERLNLITVSAGDPMSGMAIVYQGVISEAWQNFDQSPDTMLQIASYSQRYDDNRPIPPTSTQGPTDLATLISGIATAMGRNFENNGVSVIIGPAYFWGTAPKQLHEMVEAADCLCTDDQITLAIWPKNGARGGTIPLIQPSSGLIGYPKATSYGLSFRTLFNPNFKIGGKVNINSVIKPACGIWYIRRMAYDLSCLLPEGPFFTDLEAYRTADLPTAGSK